MKIVISIPCIVFVLACAWVAVGLSVVVLAYIAKALMVAGVVCGVVALAMTVRRRLRKGE